MPPTSFFERLNNWSRNSMGLKLFSIGFLILILLIPSFMIQNLIRERESRSQSVKYEVTSKWGSSQTLVGPILTIPYTQYTRDDKGAIVSSTQGNAHFLPERLEIDGTMNPEIRSRSIYEVVMYTSDIKVMGHFNEPTAEEFDKKDFELNRAGAYVSWGINDMKGIAANMELNWNAAALPMSPGVLNNDLFSNGIHVKVPLSDTPISEGGSYSFELSLKLKGSEWLSFMPVGKVTAANLSSSWSNPSFDGAFLPEERTVTDEGFEARWEILEFNRNFPQQWLDTSYNFGMTGGKGHEPYYDPYVDPYGERMMSQPVQAGDASFGVNLLMPVETYQKNMRAVKYAIMMLCLTFLSFFFIEVLNGKRIHPIQYLLVGFAIFVFYLLLLSISEYLHFSLAYLIATVATVTLITSYCRAVFKNRRNTGVIALILLVLYGFFYSLLQLQDYALLMGSLGLFGILALVMYLSRHIDWYSWGGKR